MKTPEGCFFFSDHLSYLVVLILFQCFHHSSLVSISKVCTVSLYSCSTKSHLRLPSQRTLATLLLSERPSRRYVQPAANKVHGFFSLKFFQIVGCISILTSFFFIVTLNSSGCQAQDDEWCAMGRVAVRWSWFLSCGLNRHKIYQQKQRYVLNRKILLWQASEMTILIFIVRFMLLSMNMQY